MFRWKLLVRLGLAAALLALPGAVTASAAQKQHPKLDKTLNARAEKAGKSRVIVTFRNGADPSSDIVKFGGKLGRRLWLIDGQVAELPNHLLRKLANHPAVVSIHDDRATVGTMNRAAIVTGGRAVQWAMGLDGAGVGVAVIDSGITPWHDDLTYNGGSTSVRTANGQRVSGFVDFVNGQSSPYDDNGHGTHVAGIIAGNGHDSYGARAGMAPAAHLVGLKVLDAQGRGVISNVISALDYVVANKDVHNIRVVNISVGAAVTESYKTDPLTLATKRAVDAGIVVVAAAGNLGKNSLGQTQSGGITAPGNAPWVLTVGAYSHEGTLWRFDDKMAGYSSRGPTAKDFIAKPDLVAPGTGIVSLSDPASAMYASKAGALLGSPIQTAYKPYLSLSGTSMAAPVVAGTVALMIQANPSLTPNLVKAILQYTAQAKGSTNALAQGAGFLNAHGAVSLARFYADANPGDAFPSSYRWSKNIIWGNHRISGGIMKPNGTAWGLNIVWGTSNDAEGDNIVWGTECETAECDNIVWGTMDEEDNIVWGTASEEDNIVWGTFSDSEDNIVWGTSVEEDNIVWGTDCDGADCDNIVWGTTTVNADGSTVVWGTNCDSGDCDNIVWGTNAGEEDNIVWGTSDEIEGDNIVWGTANEIEGDNIVWGTSETGEVVYGDATVFFVDFEAIFEPPLAETTPDIVVIGPTTETTISTLSTTSSGGGL